MRKEKMKEGGQGLPIYWDKALPLLPVFVLPWPLVFLPTV